MERNAMRSDNFLFINIAVVGLSLGAMTPCARAQDPAEPAAAPAPEATAEISPAPEMSTTPSAPPAPAAASGRSVRISFLPPPLEGKISLGIYDTKGELIRVLHREASFNDFTIGADALVTKWDGKDDTGSDRPAGKYHARGFLVGALKIEESAAGPAASPEPSPGSPVQVKLMPNPLTKNSSTMIDLAAGFDGKGAYLKSADGLPLITVSTRTNLARVWLAKNGEKTADFFLDENGAITPLHVSNIDKMMAFDCGDLELK